MMLPTSFPPPGLVRRAKAVFTKMTWFVECMVETSLAEELHRVIRFIIAWRIAWSNITECHGEGKMTCVFMHDRVWPMNVRTHSPLQVKRLVA
jgi:hypothetical protein